MSKRLLPIPLILLIPIVLLVVVIVAGVYRFSLTDEEILAKFPNPIARNDVIMQSLFNIKTQNPLTIKVPNSSAFTFIDQFDAQSNRISGDYIDGEERGNVSLDKRTIHAVSDTEFVAVVTVSNQGSGVFYYLALLTYDELRLRMVLADAQLLGDRIQIKNIGVNSEIVSVEYREHGELQAMAEEPNQEISALYKITEQKIIEKQSD